MEDLNLSIFSIITRVNESKMLAAHVSCKLECNVDSVKRTLNQNWNNNKCWCEHKNIMCLKKIIFEILLSVFVEVVNI